MQPLYTALAIAVARDPLGLDGESTKAIRAFSLRRVATMANEDSQFYGRKNGFCNQYCCKKQSDRPCFSRPQHVRNDGTIHYYREWISSISFADLWWPPVWRSSDLDFDVNCWNDTISTIEAEKTIREARQADRVEVKREFERRRHQTASRTLWATAPKAYY